VLAGPTSVGKSAFALTLAKALGGEIISADSMQVYSGMDIGTAKPTLEERRSVPHHLIDIRHVTDSFNVVDFYHEARHSCQQIHARNNVSIVVGGAGFYLRALMYGPPCGPPPVLELRQALEDEMLKRGSDVLFDKLKQLDPCYASTITKHDKQKIIRALEIIALTGKKVSKLPWGQQQKPQNYAFHCWFLHRPRTEIYRRIDQRCDQMLKDGFLEEVHRLKEMGIEINPSASQAIGYRQALEFLAGPGDEQSYHAFVAKFKQMSRLYAKRQFTWFRPDHAPEYRWLDLDLHDPEVALDIVAQDFKAR
jgi:tRNA dimethylallyltransferase